MPAIKNKKNCTNKLDKILEVLLPILKGPVTFVPYNTSLTTEFDMERPEIDPADIAVALLNLDRDILLKDVEDKDWAGAIHNILYRINPYLPEDIRYKAGTTKIRPDQIREELTAKLEVFVKATLDFCMRLEDNLTQRYLMNPKATNMIEVLKRRYRTNWGDNNNRSIEVSHKDAETDNTITIKFTEA